MAALAMAIFLNGMERREIKDLTLAMIASGERMSFDALGKTTVDKHSTGGVGDKITLPLAPLVASFGVAVPQLSGRGLGHTGGTLDKLESIAGWQASISNDRMMQVLSDVGAVICAAGSAWPRRTRSSTRSVTSPAPSSASRSSRRASCRRRSPRARVRSCSTSSSAPVPSCRLRGVEGARADDGRPRERRRRRHVGAAHRHGGPARADDRQRARGPRVGRGPRRWWTGRRRVADRVARRGDAPARRSAGRRPGGGAGRRPGHGHLAPDDLGPGRRPRRRAAGRPRAARGHGERVRRARPAGRPAVRHRRVASRCRRARAQDPVQAAPASSCT